MIYYESTVFDISLQKAICIGCRVRVAIFLFGASHFGDCDRATNKIRMVETEVGGTARIKSDEKHGGYSA